MFEITNQDLSSVTETLLIMPDLQAMESQSLDTLIQDKKADLEKEI